MHSDSYGEESAIFGRIAMTIPQEMQTFEQFCEGIEGSVKNIELNIKKLDYMPG
jgi:hypothetical protein